MAITKQKQQSFGIVGASPFCTVTMSATSAEIKEVEHYGKLNGAHGNGIESYIKRKLIAKARKRLHCSGVTLFPV